MSTGTYGTLSMSETRQVLREMMEDMRSGKPIYSPSPFWEELNRFQIEQLEQHGLENFKRTVNLRYFNWRVRGLLFHQLSPVLKTFAAHPQLSLFSQHTGSGHTVPGHGTGRIQSLYETVNDRIYAAYMLLLRELVAKDDPLGLLGRLSEPLLGSPVYVESGGLRVTQDVCNSVHEFYSSTRGSLPATPPRDVLELGAGYGRVAYVYLSALADVTYTIVDIPPALFISQEYLRRVFPNERLFAFRKFSSFDHVKGEFQSARIRFLSAHQIEMLPKDSVDLVLNISSLHEMAVPQVENFFDQIDRVSRGSFYTKQWIKSRVKENGLREHEYPIKRHWRTVFHERHPLQRAFFHALYRTR